MELLRLVGEPMINSTVINRKKKGVNICVVIYRLVI